MGKKGGKKGKNKKKRESEELKEEISEVDKEYYQILINDLQGQVLKHTERCQDLETQNEETQSAYTQLDEDRADIIAFLRRQLVERTAEAAELQERLSGLQQARAAEANNYETRISTLQREAKLEYEQLSAELKLLQGKLNSLEEFRAQRDDLNEKFANQEQSIRDTEENHKKAIHDIEMNFIISKDRLKKEMEHQLLQLSTEYQAATSTRMAATTQRAVRENVVLQSEVVRLRKEVLKNRTAVSEHERRTTELQRELVLSRRLVKIAARNYQREEIELKHTHSQTDEVYWNQNFCKSDPSLEKRPSSCLQDATLRDTMTSPEEEKTSGSGESGPSYSLGHLGFVVK